MKFIQTVRDVLALRRLPALTIALRHADTAGNDPFYGQLVREFYAQTQRRHRKLPLVRALQHGVAVCELPRTFEGYFARIEAAGRRNYKKCQRSGYEFRRLEYNAHLADVAAIRRSATVRQGELSADFLNEELQPCTDPPSRTNLHDYAYFGVLKDGRLVAYAGALVAGELFMIEQLYGHADFQADGVVPFLILGMAGYIPEHYPAVRFYAYGSFFGAGITLRRFKRKFCFLPHRVTWQLDGA
jgi:hypothetical protein